MQDNLPEKRSPKEIVRNEWEKIEGDAKWSLYQWLFFISPIPTLITAIWTTLPILVTLSIFYFAIVLVIVAFSLVKRITQPSYFEKLPLNDFEYQQVSQSRLEEKKVSHSLETPSPNLVCIGSSSDTFVVEDERQVLRKVPHSNTQAIIATIQNYFSPPIARIQAEITYYRLDRPYSLVAYHNTITPAWIDELTPSVSFGINEKHELVLGVRKKLEDGNFEYNFSAREKYLDPYKIDKEFLIPMWERTVIIEVRWFANDNIKIHGKFEFELNLSDENCRIEYLSDEVKLQKKKSIITRLEQFAIQGRDLLRNPKEADSNFNFGSDYHKWETEFQAEKQKWFMETVEYVSRNVGGRETSQVCLEPSPSEVDLIWGDYKQFNFDDAERFYFSIASGFVGKLNYQVIALEKIIEELKAELSSFENSSS